MRTGRAQGAAVGVVAVVWILCAAIAAGVQQDRLLAGMVAGALAVHAVRAGVRSAGAWLALAALCGLIGAAAAASLRNDAAQVAAVAAWHGDARVALEGRVVSFPAASPFGTAFLYETEAGGRRVRLATRAAFFDVGYGDVLRCRARVRARADDAWLDAREAAGTARVRLCDVDGPVLRARGALPGRAFWRWHRAVRTRFCRDMGDDAALPLALLLGERGYLDPRMTDAVIRLGIAHLLALSGMHLTAVAAIALLLSRAHPRARDVLLLAVLTCYVGVVGDVDSLTRAYLMAVLLVLARALARPVRPLDALGRALLLMLLVSPLSIRSIGLQLSFAATVAVLAAVERHAFLRGGGPRHRGWRALATVAGALLISVFVEVVIAPLQFHHFGRVSVAGPLATALFVLPVTLVQVLAMAVAVAAAVPVAGPLLVKCLVLASDLTGQAVLAAAAVTPEPFAHAGPRVPLYYAALAAVWHYPRRPAAWAAGVVLLAAAFLGR